MLKILLPAAAVIAVLAAPVAAMPTSGSGGLAAQAPDNIERVAQGFPVHRRHHRHRKPPHGWHRYDKRPWDWRERSCTQIGPFWFCP